MPDHLAPDHFHDPVLAYDRIAPFFPELARRRTRYLTAIEDLILRRLAPGSRSLLDVGGGDGSRALRVAREARIGRVVVIEPSGGMRRAIPPGTEVWPLRAEDLPLRRQGDPGDGGFDVVLCLWNVLGHIHPGAQRVRALAAMRGYLRPGGLLFADFHHRYNASAYGFLPTLGRWLLDRLRPAESNGDVTARWSFAEVRCSTVGHVFTRREIEGLASAAGLIAAEQLVVDYRKGRLRRFAVQGHLLQVFRRPAGG